MHIRISDKKEGSREIAFLQNLIPFYDLNELHSFASSPKSLLDPSRIMFDYSLIWFDYQGWSSSSIK